MTRIHAFTISVVAAGICTTTALAQSRLTIQANSQSSQHSSRVVSHTYDDSGMSPGDSYPAATDTHTQNDPNGTMGLSSGGVAPPHWVQYDLGQSFEINDIFVWNYNEVNGWSWMGMKGITMEIREFGGPFVTVYSNNLPYAAGTGPITPSLTLNVGSVTGRYIRITTDEAPDQNWWIEHGTWPDHLPEGGLSEIRIYGDPTGLGNGTTEACCFPNGSCQDLEPADCTNAGGTPEGPETECITTVCPQLEEACCFPDGTCDDLDPNVCTTQGGVPQGPGTTCAGVSCPQPEACCMPDGTCQDLLTSLCANAGGISQGVFSFCAGASCPQPEACCFDEAPWCTDLLPDDCTAAGGTRGGLGTLCASHDCLGSIVAVASNAIEMGLGTTLDGERYDLERATTLNPDWTNPPPYVIADGTNITLVGDDTSGSPGFYRWAALLPPDPCGIAPAVGNPSAGNNWDTTSAVSTRSSNEKPGRPFINVINGSGISADGCTHTDSLSGGGVDNTTMGFNQGPTSGPARPGTVPGANWVEFAFDQAYNIFDILVWNYNEDTVTPNGYGWSDDWSRQGMKEVTIQYTTVGDGTGWGSTNPVDWVTLGTGTMVLAKGTGGKYLGAQTIPMDATAQYVVFTAVNGTNANFMCDTLGGAFCTTSISVEGALSEVRFTLDDPAPAPPPPVMPPIEPAVLADVPGLSFQSVSGVVYQLERAAKIVRDVILGNPSPANNWDTTSMVSIHTAVAGGFSANHSTRYPVDTINGVGITSGPGNETDIHNLSWDDMWLGNASGGNPRGGTVPGPNWIAYDVGAVREIVGMHIWNYSESSYSEFGMKEVTIEYSSTGSTDTNHWEVYYDGQIPRASETAPSAAELVIENTVTAQYFVITSDSGIDENWSSGAFVGQDGLSEVRFLEAGVGPPALSNAVFVGTGSYTVGDDAGSVQTLFDPDGWDPANYWYRVQPQ